MFKRLTHALLLSALLFAMGGQWAVLQTVAWTTMLADNLRSLSVHDAVAKTFDGKHPCCICKVVEQGRNADQKKEFTVTTFKLEFPLLAECPGITAPPAFRIFARTNIFSESVPQQPATPPPRGCLV